MAARFFKVGGVDTNWSTIGNWSLTSGGAGGQAVPTAADDVTFDTNSGSACTLNTATAKVAKTLNTTNFTGTLTFNVQLSVSGSVTIGANTAFAGTTTNKLRMIAAGTWQTNGVTISQDIEIGGTTSFNCTLASNLTTSGDLRLSNTSSTDFFGSFNIQAATCTISGSQTITLSGNVTITGLTTIADGNTIQGDALFWNTGGMTTTGTLFAGSATIVFNGTGTWTGNGEGILSPVTINTDGTLTISGIVTIQTNTLTYTKGTVVFGGVTYRKLAPLAAYQIGI